MWKKWCQAVGLVLSLGLLPLAAKANPPVNHNQVVQAGESVYRLWGGIPLPSEVVGQVLNQQILSEINNKGFVRAQMADGSVMLFFKHGGRVHLMIGHGSGYLVSDQGHVVTNEHVANMKAGSPDIDQFGAAQIFVVRSISPNLEVLPSKILVMDAAKDLAVIQVDRLTGTPLQLADADYIQPTLPVFSVGYPGASDDLTAQRGFGDPVGFVKPTLAEGTLKRLYRNNDNTEVWEHHAPISGGNSGGPLVNRCGQVVGTNAAGHREQQNSLLAVSNQELLALLGSRQLSIGQAKGECLDAATLSTTRQLQSLYWVVGGLFLLALGGGFYLMRLKSQVKAGQNPPINSQLIRKIVGMQQPGTTPAAVMPPAAPATTPMAASAGAVVLAS